MAQTQEYTSHLYPKLGNQREEIQIKNQEFQFGSVFLGFQNSVSGLQRSFQNPKVQHVYKNFVRTLSQVLIFLYGGFIVLSIVFFPVFAVFAVLARGILFQLIALIPLWAHWIAKKISPLSQRELFLTELESLDKDLAAQMRAGMKKDAGWHRALERNWVQDLIQDARASWHFVWKSLALIPLTFVPIIGDIAIFIGQTYFVAESLGWDLFGVYTSSYKTMGYQQQKSFMKRFRWPVIGFTFPLTFLMSIPLVGPFLLGWAQAAAAHLFYNVMYQRPSRQSFGTQSE